MKRLVIDSSSLISLSSNCLLWVLDELKKVADVEFVITPEVRKEVIDKALRIERFRLGGTRVLKRLCNGTIQVTEINPSFSKKVLAIANSILKVKGKNYRLVHPAEMGLVSLAKEPGSYMLIDERIVGKLVSNPMDLKKILERRLHMKVSVNQSKLAELKGLLTGVRVVKSADLIAIAHEKGLLKNYIKECYSEKSMKDLVSGSLWGLKNSGCAISTIDINEYMNVLFK